MAANKQEQRAAALKRRRAAGGRPAPALKSPFVEAMAEAITARVLTTLEPTLAALRVGLADLALKRTRRE